MYVDARSARPRHRPPHADRSPRSLGSTVDYKYCGHNNYAVYGLILFIL
jgi:hypothetical protein